MEVVMAFLCGIVVGAILMMVVKGIDSQISANAANILTTPPEKQLEKADPADWWKNGGRAPWDEDDE